MPILTLKWYYHLDKDDHDVLMTRWLGLKNNDNLINPIVSKIALFEKNQVIFKKRYSLAIIFSVLKNLFNLIGAMIAVLWYYYNHSVFLLIIYLHFFGIFTFIFLIFFFNLVGLIFIHIFYQRYPIAFSIYLSRFTFRDFWEKGFIKKFEWYYIFIISKNIHLNSDEFNEVLKKIFRIEQTKKYCIFKKKWSSIINDENPLLNIVDWLYFYVESTYSTAINIENSVQLIKNCNKKTFYKEMKLPARLFIIYLINLLICFAISLTFLLLFFLNK